MQQGSDEWKAVRLGKVTASRVADVIARTKSGPGASRATYAAQLIVERLTGQSPEGFSSAAMVWGTETEPHAREAYEYRTGTFVDQVAFVDHPRIKNSGASPDGHIGSEGGLEIKCPNTATHLDTLSSGKPAGKYNTQMQWQMACTGRQWTDFVSYDPRLPEELRLFVVRVPRDDEMIESLEAEVVAFLAEIDARLSDLSARYGAKLADAA